MIIRSQDKKRMMNFNVCHLSITKDNSIVATNGLVSYPGEILSGIIGKYSTEEKAIKVLDMIQDEYTKPDTWAEYFCREMIIHNKSVFQMPQDSEV